jgi:hypothetical protein
MDAGAKKALYFVAVVVLTPCFRLVVVLHQQHFVWLYLQVKSTFKGVAYEHQQGGKSIYLRGTWPNNGTR